VARLGSPRHAVPRRPLARAQVLLEYEMAVAQQLANKDYIVPLLLGARRDGAGMLSLWSESEQAWKVCPGTQGVLMG
jgi:hypothetical protein